MGDYSLALVVAGCQGVRVLGGGSNFLNLKFLNFRGIRNGRKFAVSLSLGLTHVPTHRLTDLPTYRLTDLPS
jgi:hypothetical protein